MVYNKKGYDYPKSIGKRDTVSLGLDRQEFSYTKIFVTSNATITVTLYSIVHHEGPLRTGKKYLMGDPICVTYRKIPSLYA